MLAPEQAKIRIYGVENNKTTHNLKNGASYLVDYDGVSRKEVMRAGMGKCDGHKY